MNTCSLFCDQGHWHHHTNPVPYHDLYFLLKNYQVQHCA